MSHKFYCFQLTAHSFYFDCFFIFSPMSHNFQNELKKEFQLERMILFSDAVFAIAITLLAIEIKVPDIAHNIVNDQLLAQKLGELIPKFIGFFISFMVIGIYWIVHHRMFGYVTNYNQRLLWLNLFFLLAVVLMPFSSGFYSEYVMRRMKIPVILYICNITFLGIMGLVIWNYISNPKRNLSEGITPEMSKYFRFRSLVPPSAFLLLGILYFINPEIAVYVPILIPVTLRLFQRFYFKPQLKSK